MPRAQDLDAAAYTAVLCINVQFPKGFGRVWEWSPILSVLPLQKTLSSQEQRDCIGCDLQALFRAVIKTMKLRR